MFLPLNKTWNVLDRTKAVSFALHQDSVNPLISGVFPGSTAMVTRRLQWSCVYPAAHNHRGHGNGFWCFKTMVPDGWGIFSDGWMVCDIAF